MLALSSIWYFKQCIYSDDFSDDFKLLNSSSTKSLHYTCSISANSCILQAGSSLCSPPAASNLAIFHHAFNHLQACFWNAELWKARSCKHKVIAYYDEGGRIKGTDYVNSKCKMQSRVVTHVHAHLCVLHPVWARCITNQQTKEFVSLLTVSLARLMKVRNEIQNLLPLRWWLGQYLLTNLAG